MLTFDDMFVCDFLIIEEPHNSQWDKNENFVHFSKIIISNESSNQKFKYVLFN